MRNRVRELRAERKMGQASLAEAAGVRRETVWSIERGRRDPSLATALRIARALGTHVEDVFMLEQADEGKGGAEGLPQGKGQIIGFEAIPLI